MDALNLNSQLQAATARATQRPAVDVVPVAGGNKLPVEGKAEPVKAPHIDIPEVSIEQAVAQIRTFIAEAERDLQFRVDDASGRTVVSVYGGSGELIRQFPSEEILHIAATIQEQGLTLLDQSA